MLSDPSLRAMLGFMLTERTVTGEKARDRISEMAGLLMKAFSSSVLASKGISPSIHFCAHGMKARGHLSEASSLLSLRESRGLTGESRHGGLSEHSPSRFTHLSAWSPASGLLGSGGVALSEEVC